MSIWILFIGTLLLSLWATARVKSVYRRHSQGVVVSGLTGGEAAYEILRRAGVPDVQITHQDGLLGDHYDPVRRRLVLSTENFYGRSPAALGVAAHECGHAIQQQLAYKPLTWRMAAVGITTYANYVVMIFPFLGLVTGLIRNWVVMASIMAAAWGVIMLFNLITLPVEFDASARAKKLAVANGLVLPQEREGIDRVLNAAALTYVAAAVSTLLTLLYFLFRAGLLGGRRD